MFRAYSFIETLTILAILAIIMLFSAPFAFHLNDKTQLEKEAEQLRDFIYQIQTYARNTKANYVLFSKEKKDHWCLVALRNENEKEIPVCDCFNLNQCRIKDRFFYHENHFNQVRLKGKLSSNHLFLRINGISGNLEKTCAKLYTPKEQLIIGFNVYGIINIPSQDKQSQCSD